MQDTIRRIEDLRMLIEHQESILKTLKEELEQLEEKENDRQ